jgi:lipopolysaccharide/colanic/teichoic acid biosynthesis glycosyltransferase
MGSFHAQGGSTAQDGEHERDGPGLAEVRSQGPHVEGTAQTTPPLPPAATEGPRRPRTVSLALKHAIDRILAACGLIVTSPLMAAVALALRYRAGGPVLRRADRIGENGRLMTIRSFAVTDELCGHSRAWRLVAGSGLTALPQLWSVVRGEMSIIGPRPREIGFPPPPMRPGLTGLAQLEQLERWVTATQQLELDDQYARTWSLALDARIVWRTMWCVLR